VLILALSVVAGPTASFIAAERVEWVDLMAVSHRQKTTFDVFTIPGVISIRLEHAKGALVGRKLYGLRLDGRQQTLDKS
jgi:hypothetical protein